MSRRPITVRVVLWTIFLWGIWLLCGYVAGTALMHLITALDQLF